MMKKFLTYISVFALLCSCTDDEIGYVEDTSNVMELTGINAVVCSLRGQTKADVTYLEDSISRYQFVSGDKMTFTTIQRTQHNLSNFSYRDVEFEQNASGAWTRNKNTGGTVSSPDVHPERIYWSDAESKHTFIGYCLPTNNANFDWKLSNESSTYENGNNVPVKYYYGAIGNPLDTSEEINYDIDHNTDPTLKYSQAMLDEDLLLCYTTNLVADNSVAMVEYHHALSSVRVKVSISGFYGSETDAYSVVSDMKLLEQPTMYRWIQRGTGVEALTSQVPNDLWEMTPVYNQQKTLNLWSVYPKGKGNGSQKEFLFYGITVPQESNFFHQNGQKDLKLSFKVTYPDPQKNDPVNKTITKAFSATIPASKQLVYFYPGQCTTINIILNHKDDKMTVGAEYMDWQYVETPDESELKKNATMLSADMLNRNNFTIAGDAKATADDATWLYFDNATLKDIYGNDGTVSKPFSIETAQQLVSFAYEVKNNRSFKDQYVKLDANIVLQPQLYSLRVKWCGIGEGNNRFEGKFLGGGRTIRNLWGSPFFDQIGPNAVVEHLNFTDVLEVDGRGILANDNYALVAAVYVTGTLRQTDPGSGKTEIYSGSIVGTVYPQGGLIACAHVGNVEAYATGNGAIGGLVGYNQGLLLACYHSGKEKNLASGVENGYHTYEGVGEYLRDKSYAFSCYFDKDADPNKTDYATLDPGRLCYPLSMAEMQSKKFVTSSSALIAPIDSNEEWWKAHLSLNNALEDFYNRINNNEIPNSIKNESHRVWYKDNYQSYKYTYTPGSFPRVNQ